MKNTDICLSPDQYLYWHRLMGNIWSSTEWFPVVGPYRGLVPESLHTNFIS